MEMHQVRYFLATCDTLNFTKAAEFCNVSQPALTKAIRMLEEELGGELFDRQRRPLQLTDLGLTLRHNFSAIWTATHEIKVRASQFAKLENAVFTLGFMHTIGDKHLHRIVGRLQRRLPGVALAIRHTRQADLLNELRDGTLELALLSGANDNEARLEKRVLFSEPYVVAMSTDHPLAAKTNVSLNDLDGEGFVQRLHCEKVSDIMEQMAAREISPILRLMTDQDELARRMISAGLGLSILPKSLAEGALTTRPISDAEISRTVYLGWQAGRGLSVIAQEVRESIVDCETEGAENGAAGDGERQATDGVQGENVEGDGWGTDGV